MMKKAWIVAGWLALSVHFAWAGETTAYVASGDYFRTLKGEIDRAKRSIQAYVYVFTLRTNRSEALTFQLAESLAAAAKRGVRVEVVLDEFGGFEGTFAPGQGNNDAAYRYLESRGVDVSYDAAPGIVHAKAVVIDGETVIAGSNNWSESAFTQNVEACLLVRDRKAAEEALRDLGRAGRKKRPAQESMAAWVPAGFLTDKGGLGALATSHSTQGLDVYLYLWRFQTEAGDGLKDGWLTVNFDRVAESMGIAGKGSKAYRRDISKLLRDILQEAYGLITESRFEYGKDAQVRLKSFPGTETVGIPAGYWDWGWNRRLKPSAKTMYLLNRLYADAFPTRPRWSLPGVELTKRHHVSNHVLSSGTSELRRANLVEVEYGELTIDGSGPREPNVYSPNPLYDPGALEARWVELAKTYGADALKRGRGFAALVYEDSDAALVERFILLEREHGREKMDAAAEKIGVKHPSNPRRTGGYFIGILTSPER